jgi:ferredoxin-type protein NapG
VPDPHAENDAPQNRRELFSRGLGKMLSPLADYLEKRLPDLGPRSFIRPPGALPEREFLDTCYRCGTCIEVCPARAIRKLDSDDIDITGTPFIDPDIAACTVCEGLECMKSCPSGALKLVDSKYDIRIGLARVDRAVCLRETGQDCTICVDECPIGERAIRISSNGHVEVLDPGCVGCGVCQFRCPTNPKAITVEPH